MKPGKNEQLLSQPWNEIDLTNSSTWTVQVEIKPGVFVSVSVEQAVQLTAATAFLAQPERTGGVTGFLVD